MTPFFGLDVGSYYIKGVELSKGKDAQYKLLSYGLQPAPTNFATTDDPAALKSISEALGSFVKANNFSNNVVLTLPESQLFSFVLDFPKMNEKELMKSLEWEAEQYIPLPLSEVSLDYRIIGDAREAGKMEVSLIAAPKVVVNKYIRVLEDAGLSVLAVENETTSVIRALQIGEGAPTTLLLSLGANTSSVSVVDSRSIRFTRTFPIAGNTLTKVISEKLNFELTQAEEYKKVYGLSDNVLEGKVKDALESAFNSLLIEVERAVAFYNTHYAPDNIKRMLIFGGGALLPGILAYLAQRLNLEVSLGEPLKNVTLDAKLKGHETQLAEYSPILLAAIGAGMKDVN